MYRKPCIDFFRFVETELGCCSHELLLVGDNQMADYEGAAAAGWQKLLINRALSDDTRSVIHRLTSLPDMLAG